MRRDRCRAIRACWARVGFLGAGFPVGTVAVKVLGSFLIGVLVVWLRGTRLWVSPLLVVGSVGFGPVARVAGWPLEG